jgi:hypothetical protein
MSRSGRSFSLTLDFARTPPTTVQLKIGFGGIFRFKDAAS